MREKEVVSVNCATKLQNATHSKNSAANVVLKSHGVKCASACACVSEGIP